ncbi:MAG: phage Gp37/Gp68 family protein [Deltaproteobacteria bacterium]|nr:phage Gp37/Gp68 family protein [Deltaproteobacteria bacterium]
MGLGTKIEWTEATWNPVTGCTKISEGCAHCYAERMSHRLRLMGQPNYVNGFELTLHPHVLPMPLKWHKPKSIFVNSMSDLFHRDIPLDFISRTFEVMVRASWHRFQVLTKRAERLAELAGTLPWSDNIWMGVTVEHISWVSRMDYLRKVPAAVRFLSLEPLLGHLPDLDLKGIDWVILGGESGPGARHMEKSWVIDIQQQCRRANVPFFFKQWGGTSKKRAGRLLDGRTFDEMPGETRTLRKVCKEACQQ